MRGFLLAASLLLIAASPGDVISELEANGYYIESGSDISEEVVSDAVFQARADGGRLYLVVLSEEPPGGATTFSDSVLDQLGSGYVVTVAPETVGFAGDGSFWTVQVMNDAIDASLNGGSDTEVVELFVTTLTGETETPTDGGSMDGGLPAWIWMVLLGAGAVVLFAAMGRGSRRRSELAGAELARVKALAREKLAEIANDIIEMEDEVLLSDSEEIRGHYQRASAIYSQVLGRLETDPAAPEMVDVVRDLDLAIWELDAAEALLDGKPIPDKPKPPESKAPQPAKTPRQPVPEPEGEEESFGRRPQRQSSYAGNDLLTALWALLAMSGRGGGWGGMPGGFGGPMRGGGGSGRMRGGGLRGLGGRMRGGGRRG
jgi:hypothetical protein